MVAADLTLNILCAWLLADAMSGIVHWVMDKRLVADGFLAGVTEDNELHHAEPSSIRRFTYAENAAASWPAPLIGMALILVHAPIFLWLSFYFLAFGNIVHRWAHTPRRECPRVVRWLQRTGFFQSQGHHGQHHYAGFMPLTRSQASRRYCVMSNYVNGLLERL